MPRQKSGNDDTGGVNPAFPAGPRTEHKEVAAAPLYPAMQGPCGFQLCGLSVVCGLCRASILAGLALMQGTLRRCGHPVPPSRLP
ncbi:hypothetical protein IU399_30205 [Salmonella enterica subsp. enterica serovar Worthington]|nr:hypothetical protein [Salmonella enterica subsp. enterica serovar Worthington]